MLLRPESDDGGFDEVTLLDNAIAALEQSVAAALRPVECLNHSVSAARAKIELLALADCVRGILNRLLCEDNRSSLVQAFDAPYTRLSRLTVLLKDLPACPERPGDTAWSSLQECCSVVEAVLGDIHGKRFHDWRLLQHCDANHSMHQRFGLRPTEGVEDGSAVGVSATVSCERRVVGDDTPTACESQHNIMSDGSLHDSVSGSVESLQVFMGTDEDDAAGRERVRLTNWPTGHACPPDAMAGIQSFDNCAAAFDCRKSMPQTLGTQWFDLRSDESCCTTELGEDGDSWISGFAPVDHHRGIFDARACQGAMSPQSLPSNGGVLGSNLVSCDCEALACDLRGTDPLLIVSTSEAAAPMARRFSSTSLLSPGMWSFSESSLSSISPAEDFPVQCQFPLTYSSEQGSAIGGSNDSRWAAAMIIQRTVRKRWAKNWITLKRSAVMARIEKQYVLRKNRTKNEVAQTSILTDADVLKRDVVSDAAPHVFLKMSDISAIALSAIARGGSANTERSTLRSEESHSAKPRSEQSHSAKPRYCKDSHPSRVCTDAQRKRSQDTRRGLRMPPWAGASNHLPGWNIATEHQTPRRNASQTQSNMQSTEKATLKSLQSCIITSESIVRTNGHAASRSASRSGAPLEVGGAQRRPAQVGSHHKTQKRLDIQSIREVVANSTPCKEFAVAEKGRGRFALVRAGA